MRGSVRGGSAVAGVGQALTVEDEDEEDEFPADAPLRVNYRRRNRSAKSIVKGVMISKLMQAAQLIWREDAPMQLPMCRHLVDYAPGSAIGVAAVLSLQNANIDKVIHRSGPKAPVNPPEEDGPKDPKGRKGKKGPKRDPSP